MRCSSKVGGQEEQVHARRKFSWKQVGAAALLMLSTLPLQAAEPPTIERAMIPTPRHFDQDYDTPSKAQYAACKVSFIKHQNLLGWEVLGPQGQTLRRFLDTDGDGGVDQYSYFRDGLEVYRDMDTNKNAKVDQARWLNTGGSRWAIDANEDGRIDGWKQISPEEVSQVAVRALVKRDASLLSTILVTPEDLRQLGLPPEVTRKVLDAVSDPAGHLRKIDGENAAITAETKWLQFNGSSPSVIPSDQVGTREDLHVYENTMAVVDFGRGKGGLIQTGEMVRISNVWKLASLPVPQAGNNAQVLVTGLLMQAGASNPIGAQQGPIPKVSPEVQKLIEQLQAIDKQAPGPDAGREANRQHYQARLAVLGKLVEATSGNEEDQSQWIRQIAEFLSAGIQSEAYLEGADLLKQWETRVSQARPKGSPLVAHIAYLRMLSDYTVEMKQAPNANRQKVQAQWLKTFEGFVRENSGTEEGADAAWRIAVINEFNGEQPEARKWYELLAQKHSQTDPGKRAVGALRRLNLQGKSLSLAGPTLQGDPINLRSYRNRFVLVVFWSTWCVPCTQDLPQIIALYQKYREKGFEVVGVNLDTQNEAIGPYIQKHGVPWPSIHQPGGLESPLAREYGIVSLPTMFLVAKDGKVINRQAAVVDVKNALETAYDKK